MDSWPGIIIACDTGQGNNSRPINAPTRTAENLHRIVGGGAGGLELATRLGDSVGRRQQAQVTLIDRSRTHLWKPLLHEVAAGSMDFDQHTLDYLAQARWHHFRFRLGSMAGLDRERRVVRVAPTRDDEGNLLIGGSLFIEGLFARFMYVSLYRMHLYALHGFAKVVFGTLVRLITRRTELRVKLH